MSAFVISVKENDSYKYTFEHRRGRTLLTSIEYPNKQDIYTTIDFLQKNFSLLTISRYKTVSGKFYFKILLDQQTYATSRKFNTSTRFENAIDEIHKNFHQAEILDFSHDVFSDFPVSEDL
ncbi:hypothetical protein [Myroides sp. LJL119]